MKNQLFSTAMKYGLYLALLSIVIEIITWSLNLIENFGLMTTALVNIVTLGISIFFLLYLLKKYRDDVLSNSITFSQAFILGVLSIVFASVIKALYAFSFHSWIDPEYAAQSIEVIKEKSYEMLVNNGADEDQIDTVLSQFEDMPVPTPAQAMMNKLKGSIVGGSLLSFICALIIKKNLSNDAFGSAMNELKDEE